MSTINVSSCKKLFCLTSNVELILQWRSTNERYRTQKLKMTDLQLKTMWQTFENGTNVLSFYYMLGIAINSKNTEFMVTSKRNSLSMIC